MRVIVDTSVWSEYFRRKKPANSDNTEILKELIRQGRAVMPGIVKQELLSGIKEPERFEKLRHILSGFDAHLADELDHILAARFFNLCRLKGIQGSFSDFLICAQASRAQMAILTSDKDFDHYQGVIPFHYWAPC